MEEIFITDEKIEEYCIQHTSSPSPTQKELIPATQNFSKTGFNMQVGPLEGKFLSLVTQLMNAKYVLEFGTFTGYSSLSFAEAVSPDGRVTTLDRDPSATDFAKKYWEKAGFSEIIELILGDAQQNIHKLQDEVANKTRPQFDLAFIDADKAGYPLYWEACLKLVRKGGAILVDNVLWSGNVLNPTDKTDHIIADFNKIVTRDSRVEKVLLPIRDGIYLARVL